MVQKLISARFIDGQLAECNLTLGDLHAIARAFTRGLTGIYHFRVMAEGSTLRGLPFTREDLVTGAITATDGVSTVPTDQPSDTSASSIACFKGLSEFRSIKSADAARNAPGSSARPPQGHPQWGFLVRHLF
jgi:hypothetical protein